MELTELRIGNWVKYQDKHLQVIEFSPYMICCAPHWGFDNFEDIEGIPLTPEILEKCGFNYGNNKSGVLRLEIAYLNEDYPCTLQVSGSGIQICRSGVGSICPSIFYLHQLQNLYFALTGKELEINLS
jgi:hypothetical protein